MNIITHFFYCLLKPLTSLPHFFGPINMILSTQPCMYVDIHDHFHFQVNILIIHDK